MDIFRPEKMQSMQKKQVYVETYGCQMNMADTEKVLEIVKQDREWIIRGREECEHYWIGTGERNAGRLGDGQLHRTEPERVYGHWTLD